MRTGAGSGRKGKGRASSVSSLTLEGLRRSIAAVLEMDPGVIGGDDDLLGYGIDSLQLIRLANGWRRHGVTVKFAELFEKPTLQAWWALISERMDQPPARGRSAEGDGTVPFTLAPMQQAYWIGRHDDQVLGGVSAHFYAEFDGPGTDPARLERAIRAVIERHGMLRARFLDDGRQQILQETPWLGLTVHDLRACAPDTVTRELNERRRKLSGQRLDTGRGEVLDVQLSLLPGGASRTHVNIDMLVSDAQSYKIVLDDLANLYLWPDRPLRAIGYSFQRYLAEQAMQRSDAAEQAEAYWRQRLNDLPGPPQLPLAAEPERIDRSGAGRRYHWVPGVDRRQLAERARVHRLTLPVVFATAFAEVLGAWSAEPDFLLNIPLFDREEYHPDVPLLVGDFSNLIMLSVNTSGELPFTERAARLQERLRADAAHAEYSGVAVLRDLARSRAGDWMAAPVVFTSVLGMGELFGETVRRCLGTPVWTSSETPQVWLDCQVIEQDDGILLNWDVIEELFPDGLIDAMFAAYLRLLSWLRDPQSDWMRPLPSLLPPGQAAVRSALNEPAVAQAPALLHEGCFQQAARHPERVALAWGDDGQLTYGELVHRALRVAAALMDRGVTPGDAVAITLPRGPEQITAVLGVLAAGGAYVPVGIDQPAERRARIYANAGTRVVVTGAAEAAALDWPRGTDVLALEEAQTGRAADGPLLMPAGSLAYIIYTSGSTGEPKGVEIAHQAVMNTIADVNLRFTVGAGDRVLGVSALDFDLSVYDIFGLLSAGGAVIPVSEEDRREARRWCQLMRRWDVTVWNSVPAVLDMLVTAAGEHGLPASLRLALVSGDWVGLDLPGRLAAAAAAHGGLDGQQLGPRDMRSPARRLVALGGATEASIWSNHFEVSVVEEHWRSIPYGYPLRGQKYRVVDSRGRDCPDWVPGELRIGGAGLARGYRADAERTARQFVIDRGERWYRTADIGRYWPDGTLEFLGRADHQVKIRGHRIELGEVEAALESHPQVARAVATVHGKQSPSIAAAVVPCDRELLESRLLRHHLAGRLPAYMIPASIAILETLPLSTNGKVDRGELARLVPAAGAETLGERPRGPVETALARMWAGLLGVADLDRDRSFFALGGDSLLATRMVETVRQRFGAEVTLRELFTVPTVAELAALISARVTEHDLEDGEMEEGAI